MVTPGIAVSRRIARLDPAEDADEIARLSLVVLHGNAALTSALFTVAFMKQVAVPTMARILHRRGTGDIMRETALRNDDTIVFFGQLLDHGPDSAVGSAWIERLNAIHAHFPLRNSDSLYTLATLALDPHAITASLGRSPFTPTELEAQWLFWRRVAQRQQITDIPAGRAELAAWSAAYERAEYAPSPEGRAVTGALVDAFAVQALPRVLRPLAGEIIATVSPPVLREVHGLPEPRRRVRLAVRAAVGAYVAATPLRPVRLDRSFVEEFGVRRHGHRRIDEVGYQRPARRHTDVGSS
ncbi:oxygenase MpaB family protein [Nocardioides daeguensis]|uniref:ER-bound oxygenase mpaB/mpaB'/Rubber oxygenase catalytic domain-containing protein n=1 Tax=Nocardioides daeguensis TaxID=908359 RepID=A0ABP6VHE8_9ACTN|nr:oxygenase MpaB family protein [Nocardioides daeguensis]MBV6728996.1 DUF2236 domain-containing protein [Nocardioides daeguensis]MCR1773517.1 DUF2236 domain-containing protein [Nocardioides daeguensis]